eukprot:1431898-Prymnesium_polylepis.1
MRRCGRRCHCVHLRRRCALSLMAGTEGRRGGRRRLGGRLSAAGGGAAGGAGERGDRGGADAAGHHG